VLYRYVIVLYHVVMCQWDVSIILTTETTSS